MSIEALAMAGADYIECGINLEMWECSGTVELPPPYLLAEEEEEEEEAEEEDQCDDYLGWGIISHERCRGRPDFEEPPAPEHLLAEKDDPDLDIVIKKGVNGLLLQSEQMGATQRLATANAVAATKSKSSKIVGF